MGLKDVTFSPMGPLGTLNWTPKFYGVGAISYGTSVSTFYKLSGDFNYDTFVGSVENYKSCYCSSGITSATSSRAVLGLSTISNIANFNDIQYGWFIDTVTGNQVVVIESGTHIITSVGLTASTVVSITNDGNTVRYYKDGAVIYTSTVIPSGSYYFQATLYNVSDQTVLADSAGLKNVTYGPMGPIGQQGVQGTQGPQGVQGTQVVNMIVCVDHFRDRKARKARKARKELLALKAHRVCKVIKDNKVSKVRLARKAHKVLWVPQGLVERSVSLARFTAPKTSSLLLRTHRIR